MLMMMMTTTTTMTMVIVLHHDCTVSSSSLSNSCDGADPSLHGCCTRLACVQAGFPAEPPSFYLRRVRTRRRTGKDMNVKKKEFFPIFAWFPMCSHCVPFKFPSGFPMCSPSSQCVPQSVLHSTSLLSYMLLANVVLLSHLVLCGAKGKELYTSK